MVQNELKGFSPSKYVHFKLHPLLYDVKETKLDKQTCFEFKYLTLVGDNRPYVNLEMKIDSSKQTSQIINK